MQQCTSTAEDKPLTHVYVGEQVGMRACVVLYLHVLHHVNL